MKKLKIYLTYFGLLAFITVHSQTSSIQQCPMLEEEASCLSLVVTELVIPVVYYKTKSKKH